MDFPTHFQHIFRQLNYQRIHAQLCDCVVLVGGQTFQAHSAILAASSSHFRALLSSNDSGDEGGRPSTSKSECGGPRVMELDPEVVTPEAFSTLLDMIYTSTLSLGTSNVMDVLLAASHLHLNAVVKACKLHLSKKNFPAAPPKGWRSVHSLDNPQQKRAAMYQQVTNGLDEDSEEDAVVEVSQSIGVEDQTASSSRQKRKSEGILSDRKKPCTGPREIYKECSPTVSRSLLSTEDSAEDLLSPDSLRLPDRLWESPGEEEDSEEKYEASKGESDEIQLPSQSDSSLDICNWENANGNHGDNVVKVKIGPDEEQEGPIITMVEVKREHINSPELKPVIEDTFQSLASNQSNYDKMTTNASVEADDSIIQSHLSTHLNGDEDKSSGNTADDPVGLDSLSDLTFSCFLNPTADSVIGALEEDSLASLTAAATAAAAASDAPVSMHNPTEMCPNENETHSSSRQSLNSSLGFPVASVPLQQLIPTKSSGFTDTLILQPAPTPLTGYLNSLGPGLTLEASVVQPSPGGTKSRSGGSSGVTAFRRIAPKVPPGSEANSDASGEAAERPSLTKASEDVLSKCKKAAAEDHVLLVEGDKKYACKICCKTFMNLTDCKKHIRVHTGEKPYPCPKCGKRFSQSSHLYKHTKNSCQTWKDEQPFSDSITT